MEDSSASSEDGSVIICIDTDTDELPEKNQNDQEMEIISSYIIQTSDDVSNEDKIPTEPDSSKKMPEIPPVSQVQIIESTKEGKIEDTSSDCNPSLLLENKVAVETNSVSPTTGENTITEKPFEEENEEVVIIEETKNEKSLHIPTKILKGLIIKAILSTTKGFLTLESIVKFLTKRVQCSEKKMGFLRKITLNTLKNNSDVFIPHVVQINSSFVSGFWILHPLATFKYAGNVFLEKKNEISLMQQKDCTIGTSAVDNRVEKKVAVTIKRSSTLDFWASKKKVAKLEYTTMIMPSTDVVNKLMNYGVSCETKWEGWTSLDIELENKISKLERIIENSSNLSPKALLKRSGVKRVRLSDSCSDIESSDSDLPGNGSIVCKEHNYVASKDSSGSKNLIESVKRKIVQKMDCDKKSVNKKSLREKKASRSDSQHEEEDFLGFDYDFPSGYWRGWEKASSRNADRMREISRNQRGRRDMEEELRESVLAVSRILENSERCNLRNEENVQNQRTCNLDSMINKYIEELLIVYDGKPEEPRASYVELLVMAACTSPELTVTVDDICQFILCHFPFYGRKGRHSLEPLLETILQLAPATFICSKSRRPSNPATYWRVDPAAACAILSRALKNAKMTNGPPGIPPKNSVENHQVSTSPQNMKTTDEDKSGSHDSHELNAIKSQPGVIVSANSLMSSGTTCHKKHETHVNINKIQLNRGKSRQPKINKAKDTQRIADVGLSSDRTPTQIYTNKTRINQTVENLSDSKVVSSVPVILSVDSLRESSKIKQNFTHPRSAKIMEPAENINATNSPFNTPLVLKEDQEVDIVDIDPYLQDKENSLGSEDDELIVDDETEPTLSNVSHGHGRLFGNEQSSISNEVTNDVCDRTSNCLFLVKCRNSDSDSKQYPCYICHKFYMSYEAISIHFAQTHSEKENIHVTSALCQNQKRKPKSSVGTKKMVLISPEKTFKSEVIGSRPRMENLLLDLQPKHSDSVIRYRCSKCYAIFHEQETLDMHISYYHGGQATSTEGNLLYYYCGKCSECFHTEKALDVHKCVPFSSPPPSFT